MDLEFSRTCFAFELDNKKKRKRKTVIFQSIKDI
jgi:hypothetical protein